jgi:DNA polymerase-3 subunit gamma/tau
MAYQALARRYRPQTFADVIGQETIVRTLQNAIEEQRIHHAYLFSGVRGVGKTTAARILAKALNCEHGPTVEPDNTCTICREITEGIDMDVREIDAATYTGVDNIRELRDTTQFQPARDRYRIFIIDEAHMLSTGAWNALLKILEEPPSHVIFMFATTEIHKVPQTIISRVQKFMLRKITLDELIQRLSEICASEGIEAERDAIEMVARRGEGSARDALSLLDQIIAFSGRKITANDVSTILGLSDTTFFAHVISLIGDGNHAGVLEALQEASEGGRDFRMLYRDLLNFVRNLLLISGGANSAMLAVSPEDLGTIESVAEKFTYTELLRIANLLLRDDETVNRAEHQRLAVEIALLKAATFPRLRSVEAELRGGGGGNSPSPGLRPPPPGGRGMQATLSPSPTGRGAGGEGPGKSASADVKTLIDRVRKTRPMAATYLADAAAQQDGSRIVFTFDDSFKADSVSDAKAVIEEAARELFGHPMKIDITVAAPREAADNRRAEDSPKPSSPLRDDPVVKSFQKHLGGEIVESRKR